MDSKYSIKKSVKINTHSKGDYFQHSKGDFCLPPPPCPQHSQINIVLNRLYTTNIVQGVEIS